MYWGANEKGEKGSTSLAAATIYNLNWAGHKQSIQHLITFYFKLFATLATSVFKNDVCCDVKRTSLV